MTEQELKEVFGATISCSRGAAAHGGAKFQQARAAVGF